MSVEMLLPQQFKYAILLDIPVEEIANNKLVQYIDSWYGTPYRYGGNDKNGIDCSAFVQTFMQYIYGIALARISAEQYKQSKRIHREDLEEGDLVFFVTRGRRAGVSHVGIYLCNNKFVHASTSGGVMISSLDEPYYQSHYSGAGRVKESIVSK
jgi:lipoprotein Spr